MSNGLRERKKAETRAALQDAALRLAEQHGVDKVSVEAIAEAAGVSPRTFFNYFPSKDDAIIGLAPSEPSPLLGYLLERPLDEAPSQALRHAIHASIERLQEDPDRWALRRRLVQRHPDLAARYAARLAEVERDLVVEIARRLDVDPDLDIYPGTVVGASMAATRMALTIWQNHDDPPPLAQLIDQAFDLLASGLAPPRPKSTSRSRSR
jgi:AcrR family transcriptional regulator